MDYFSKLLRASPKDDHAQSKSETELLSFTKSWLHIKETLEHPDERQLSRGIQSTEVPAELEAIVNTLVTEAGDSDVDTTGACLEYTLKNDVLNALVRLSQKDQPFGILAEVVKGMLNLVVLMDEHFLVHATVHKAVLRLLRACVRNDYEIFDGGTKAMGAAAARGVTADYEGDLVNLMCALCSRIRLYPELLLIFFYDKHVYHAMDEAEDEKRKADDEEDDADLSVSSVITGVSNRSASPAPSSVTVTSAPTSYPASSVYRRPEYEFLLYNHLLRFVHREGEIGDYARSGLLFLLDVATSLTYGRSDSAAPSDPLSEAATAFSEYVLEGDFADVLAAALGAVYSLLPSKLIVRREGGTERNGGMVLGGMQPDPEEEAELQAELEKSRAFGLDTSTSPEFKARLQHFVKMIEFVQDVIQVEMSTSDDGRTSTLGASIAKSILKFLRSSFLTNVLYPSVLECSDSDGSAVAVITYMDALLSTIKEPKIADVVIKFLTSEEDPEASRDVSLINSPMRRKKGRPKPRRPKSTAMTLLQLESNPRPNLPYYNSLGRFTLKDLLLSNVESKSQYTASAALQLLHTLLRYHGQLSLDRLFTLIPDTTGTTSDLLFQSEEDLKTPRPGMPLTDDEFFSSSDRLAVGSSSTPFTRQATVRLLREEVDEVDLYRNLAGRLDHTYMATSYSGGDSQYLQDAEAALDTMSSLMGLDGEGVLPSRKYRLLPTDPLAVQLLESMQRFFSHSAEQNLALTGVIHAIACSPQMSLSGWLTYDPSSPSSTQPAMYTCFASLVAQVPQYGMQAPHFEKYLDDRRRGLLSSAYLADAIDVELTVQRPERPPEPAPAAAAPSTPSKAKKPRSSGFVAYFSPRRAKSAAVAVGHDETPAPETRAAPSREFESPVAQHYRETASVTVTPLKGTAPREGPWSPTKGRKKVAVDEEDRDVVVAWGGEVKKEEPEEEEVREEETTTLSVLLDNIVVLEEALKEIAAVLEMRRAMGIDD